jgi:membrane protease subunit HflK
MKNKRDILYSDDGDKSQIKSSVFESASAVELVLLFVIIAMVLVFGAMSTVFTVAASDEAVVTQFGAYDRTVGPGIHMKFPWIENVRKVPVKSQLRMEFGFRTGATRDTEQRAGGGSRNRTHYTDAPKDEAEVLTGDLYVIHLEWSTQFRITSAKDWLFSLRDPLATFADLNEATVREILGDRTFDEALTTGRTEIQEEVHRVLQARCKLYGLPITVDQVILQDVAPPASVQQAFIEVNGALQEKETLINNAQKEYNAVIPKARGEAIALVSKAIGNATEQTNKAYGDIARFRALYASYTNSPEMTRIQLYIDAMNSFSTCGVSKVVVDDKLPPGFIYAPNLKLTK